MFYIARSIAMPQNKNFELWKLLAPLHLSFGAVVESD